MGDPMKRILVIAGSDSSAGAGLQADLKTAQAFGVYAQTAVTAVTAQNTRGVAAIAPMPPELVRAQIEAALDDIGADAIKIGMLGNGAIAAAVADVLDGVGLPLVLDPVLLSTSGAVLLDEAGVEILKTRLIPRATLLTPNLPEAEKLLGFRPDIPQDAMQVVTAMKGFGVAALLLKGGHGAGDAVTDTLFTSENIVVRVMARQDTRHTHGTGCTLATAIACSLAKGLGLGDAVVQAQNFVQEAIRTAPGLGAGQGPLNHVR